MREQAHVEVADMSKQLAIALSMFGAVACAHQPRAGASAQEIPAGSVHGRLIDPWTHDSIAGAQVVATSPALRGQQIALSDSSGGFELEALPAGTYQIDIQRDGYRPWRQPDITVRDRALRIKLMLVPDRSPTLDTIRVGSQIATEPVDTACPVEGWDRRAGAVIFWSRPSSTETGRVISRMEIDLVPLSN